MSLVPQLLGQVHANSFFSVHSIISMFCFGIRYGPLLLLLVLGCSIGSLVRFLPLLTIKDIETKYILL